MRMCLAVVLTCAAGCAADSTSAVFPPGATSFELDQAGGLSPTPAAGSTCTPANESYTYVLATKVLSSNVCSSPTADGVYAFVAAQATLSDAAAGQLVAALGALEPPPQPCGSDLTATLVVTVPSRETTYDAAECLVGFDDVVDAIHTAMQ